MKPPFPWFGGKSRVASTVWKAFGNVRNYVEPFMGSLAVLLARPLPFDGTETVNDADGFLCNFWRAVEHDPDSVAKWADYPVSECDMHARHVWLRERRGTLTRRLEGDPDYFDPKIAGWWVWGQCCWIGSGWCSEGRQGPWVVVEDEEGFKQFIDSGKDQEGVWRQLVHLGNAGRGVNRQLVHLGNAGQGVNRQLVHLGNAGQGDDGDKSTANGLEGYFKMLSRRLRRVRVCCGDWARVCGPTPTVKQGLTGVFLDPPYADAADRAPDLYAKDSGSVAHDARQWAVEHGDDRRLRIALCGYSGEHDMPPSWKEFSWKTRGGYGSQSGTHDNPNAKKERIWFSPHCLGLHDDEMPIFSLMA